MGKGKILIAEDEAIISEDLKTILERSGYSVPAIAVSGEEVVAKALKIKPDLLLLDIVLKGKIDGIMAATQIYEKLNIPIVYLTAYSDEKTFDRAKKTEPYGYIIKPYNERDLLITIEMALLHYRPCIKVLEQKCRTLLEAVPDAILICHKEIIILANREAENLFGYKWSELIGKPIEILVPERFRDAHIEHRETYYANPSTRPMGVWSDLYVRRKDGAEFPVSINLSPMKTSEGLFVLADIRDISKTRRTEAELSLLQDIAHDIIEAKDFLSAMNIVLRKVCEKTGWIMGEAWIPSADGSRLECSSAWHCNNCGLEEFRKASKEFTFLPGVGLPGRAWSSKKSVWIPDIIKDNNFSRLQLASKAGIKAGVAIPVMVQDKVVAIMDFFVHEEKEEDSRFINLVSSVSAQLGIFIQQKLTEEHITYLAYHDLLTDLPNRLMLHDIIEEAISNGNKNGVSFALFIVDLDHFRDINDTLGHNQGDSLLLTIARLLKNAFADTATVARLGGDDFAIITPVAGPESVSQAVDKITKIFSEPIVIQDIPVSVNTYVGVSVFPSHGEDTHTLLRRADIALNDAKKHGTPWAVYSPGHDRFTQEHLALIGALKKAIDANHLFLLYQPKIDLKTTKVVGIEALVRWRHPIKGIIPPDQFIFLAEHSGLINSLTNWVLTDVIRQATSWSQEDIKVPVAVNISVKDIRAPLLSDQIKRLINTGSIDPGQLRFEITESLMMADPKLTNEILTKLSIEVGVSFSIDDFGTGYSSLKYLQDLPVDEIKIDKSFILHMMANKNKMNIVRFIIELAHSLGLQVVAEGVETREVLDKLIYLGCDIAQGYFISRPIPPDEFAAWLSKHG